MPDRRFVPKVHHISLLLVVYRLSGSQPLPLNCERELAVPWALHGLEGWEIAAHYGRLAEASTTGSNLLVLLVFYQENR